MKTTRKCWLLAVLLLLSSRDAAHAKRMLEGPNDNGTISYPTFAQQFDMDIDPHGKPREELIAINTNMAHKIIDLSDKERAGREEAQLLSLRLEQQAKSSTVTARKLTLAAVGGLLFQSLWFAFRMRPEKGTRKKSRFPGLAMK